MRRTLRFVFRNWPLKLGAIVLACVLYAGLVLGQNTQPWVGQVPIQLLNQPTGAFNLSGPQFVTYIRLYAPPDVASQLSSTDFDATADLSGVQPQLGGAPVIVPVRVVAKDPRVTILDYRPRQISVRLDPIVTRTVPVVVDRGTIPAGLAIGPPQLDVTSVTIRGGSSLVDRVTQAVARVSIDPSGINVDGEVDLIAVDARGDQVAPVEITPSSVHVRIDVSRVAATRTVPVAPTVTGSPAAGYVVKSVTVTPAVVEVSGLPAAVGALQTIPTASIDLAGRTAPAVVSVALTPPAGVTVAGAASVQVSIDIEPQTGSQTFPVGFTLIGAQSSLTYSLAVSSAAVTLGGPVPTLDAIAGGTLTATLDVSGLGPGGHDVSVAFRTPAGTNLIALSPTRVTVTVAPAASPAPTPSVTAAPT